MKHNAHPDYRPDIDGLRAVAILSVVAYHAFPSLLPGGFIGVDVFFVISGYLISTILFKSHEAGTFSYLDFYIRRARRIFPSLALVLAFSLAAGWWIFIPREFQPFGNQVAYGAGFTANILFIREAGYWDSVAELKPLLHLWSLGVEEQYYLLWPAMIALFWRRSHNFLLIVVPVFLASFVLNVAFLPSMPEAVFYSPLTRFWELMVGGLLAYLTLHQIPQVFWWLLRLPGGRVPNLLSWGGLVVLGLGFAWIDHTMRFPGWWALFPVVGAFLVILGGMNSWVSRYFLAHPVMVYVGLISYPLYLWHWPLLSFAKYVSPEPSEVIRLLLEGAAVLLAMLTYHFVEIPIRTRMSSARAALCATVCVIFLGGAGILMQKEKISSFHNAPMVPSQVTMKIPEGEGVTTFPIGRHSYARQGNAHQDVILWAGDSNMLQYYPRVDYLLRRKHPSRSALFFALPGCLPIPQVRKTTSDQCDDFGEEVIQLAQKDEVSTVALMANWVMYFERVPRAEFHQDGQHWEITKNSEGHRLALLSLERMMVSLRGKGKKVFLISNIPMGEQLLPLYQLQRPIFTLDEFSLTRSGGILKTEFVKQHGETLASIRRVALAAGVRLIEPVQYLCDGEMCPAFTPQGDPIYFDISHMESAYVRNQVFYLDQIFLP